MKEGNERRCNARSAKSASFDANVTDRLIVVILGGSAVNAGWASDHADVYFGPAMVGRKQAVDLLRVIRGRVTICKIAIHNA